MLLIEFLNKVAIKNGKLNNKIQNQIWWKSKGFENGYEEVYKKTSFLSEDVKIVERIYCILNNITDIVKCDYCKKNKVKFRKFKFGYSKNCCAKCAGLNPTTMENYKNTCKERYGTTSTFASKEVKEKTKITCLKKYGTENPMSNIEIRKKVSKTKLNFDSERKKEIGDKIKNTFFEKYNGHPMSTVQTQNNLKQSLIKKYGVDNISKNKKSFEKFNSEKIQKYLPLIEESNLELLEYKLEGLKNKNFKIKCKTCGNVYIDRLIKNGIVSRCKICFPKNQTKAENELVLFLSEYIDKNEIIKNDRSLLKPLEIDLLIKNKNFAIEYDGLFYHSFGKSDNKNLKLKYFHNNIHLEEKNKNYHYLKTEKCKNHGIELFHILDLEWNSKQKRLIWKDILKKRIGIFDIIENNSIKIEKIQIKNAKEFNSQNSLSQYKINENTISMGLFKNGIQYQQICYEENSDAIEIKTFCNKIGINVLGKDLFDFLIKIGKDINIKIDKKYENSNYLIDYGFKNNGFILPTFFYYKGRKMFEFEKFDKTENELLEDGYRKYWNCGYEKLIYEK